MKKPIIIIAEAGVNHNGKIENAKKLIKIAADAGADFVKFQTFKTEKLVLKETPKANYQKINSKNKNESQFEMLKKLEIPLEWYAELIKYCSNLKIKFLSTAFDVESVDLLDSLNIEIFKIPSGELTNKILLKKVASKSKPVILSTGMSYLTEIKDAFKVLTDNGLSEDFISILHCNSEYPTPFEDVNLKAIKTLQDVFGDKIGYSDHTIGNEVSIAAVALGSIIIEKHFTIDNHLEGPDHKASANPKALKNLVKSIRNIELANSGNGIKEPSNSEMKNILLSRKSMYFKSDFGKGHILNENDIVCLRPASGLSPMLLDEFVGKELTVSVNKNSVLSEKHFKL